MRCKFSFSTKDCPGIRKVAHERVLLQLQAVDCSEFDRTKQNNPCVINEEVRTIVNVELNISLSGTCSAPKDRFLRMSFICELAEVAGYM